MRVLSPAGENPIGWSDPVAGMAVVYDFVLQHAFDTIRIEITQAGEPVASILAEDATYPSGRFGFYNYSQESVRYEGLRFEPLP